MFSILCFEEVENGYQLTDKTRKKDAMDAKDKIDSLGDMEQRINECDELIDSFISSFCFYDAQNQKIIYRIEK